MTIRDRLLRASVLFGIAVLAITEALSALHALSRGPLIIAWIPAVFIGAVVLSRMNSQIPANAGGTACATTILCAAGIVAILSLTFATAAFSPPNSSDAMAYHMPRVVYWAEQGSVRFFPTPYLNQIMLQPLAEYLMLHTYILSGGDRFINFVQWFSSVGCVIGVSALAACLGAKRRGQWIAALFCATLPVGILASSGAKNDYFLALWLVSAAYFAFQLAVAARWIDAIFLGMSCGLALYTKATAYIFAPFILAAILMPAITRAPRRLLGRALAAGCLAIALNAPQYVRNFDLSGSVMGFDSAQGDGVYRWRSDKFGWKPTVSNILRHTSEQLGARSERWNALVFRFVTGAHEALGIDVNDPATTWPYTNYRPPRNANHETDAPNRVALIVLTVIGLWLLIQAVRGRDRERAAYALSIVLAFIAYCAYLKWQLFMGRLLLPLFVLASPLAAALEEILTPTVLQLAACLLLLDSARLPTLENWVRPLRGPSSIFRSSRDSRYFADMKTWDNAASYFETVRVLGSRHCGLIGVDITDFQLEYPLQALLRERNPNVLFVHTGVTNASARYAPPAAGTPCAIVCLDCAGDNRRLSIYRDYAVASTTGKFVVLTR